MSLSVISRPSRSWSSRAASVEVSAMEDLSASMEESFLEIFLKKKKKKMSGGVIRVKREYLHLAR